MRFLIGLSCLLLLTLKAHSQEFEIRNPAEYADNYYSYHGLSLSLITDTSLFSNPDSYDFAGDFYLFRPSRTAPVVHHQTGIDTNLERIYYRQARAIRKSSQWNSGWSAESGFDYGENRLDLNFEPGVYLRPNNRFRIGLKSSGKVKTDFRHSIRLTNRLTTALKIRLSPAQIVGFEVNSHPDLELFYKTGWERLKLMVSASTNNLTESSRRLQGLLSLSYDFRDSMRGQAQIERRGDYYHNLSWLKKTGEYSPPITYNPAFIPIAKSGYSRYGIGIKPLVNEFPAKDIAITVRRGDNLTLISRNLPPDADDAFRNNVSAIAAYNNLQSASIIHPGQTIRIPSKIIVKREKPSLYQDQIEIIEEMINSVNTSNIMEIKLIGALWKWQISGRDGMISLLPLRADIENIILLNTQAMAEIADRSFKSAVRKLHFALLIDQDCVVTIGNLALAYYLDEKYEESLQYMNRFLSIAPEYGLDTALHRSLLPELEGRTKE